MIRRRLRRAAVVVAATAVATTACLRAPATDRGREVAELYQIFMVAAGGVFLLVIGLLAWTVIRHRGEPGRSVPMPRQVHGNVALEITWWALPTALVALLAVLTAIVLGQVDAHDEEPALMVEVGGFQWGWEFTYAESGVVVAGTAADPPTLPLPVDRTIAFVVTSRDVVHSFHIPNFLIKRDAVPNFQNRFDVVIEEEATYGGQCAEFCGLLHARQLFEIDAIQQDVFDAWLAEQAAAQP